MRHGAIGTRIWEMCIAVLCVSFGSPHCYFLHGLQIVNAGRGYKRLPYGRDILTSIGVSPSVCHMLLQ